MINILKIPCKISILLIIYLLLALSSGFIKNIIIIYFIILIHEIGHIIVIQSLGYKIISCTFYPFGGKMIINKPINSPIFHDILIALAGITAQLVIFLIATICKQYINNYTYNLLIIYNTLIIILNILPIYPLDGYNFFNALLNYFCNYYTSLIVSNLLSIILLISGLIIVIFSKTGNYVILLFFLTEFFILLKNNYQLFNRFIMERLYRKNYYRSIKYLSKPSSKKFYREKLHYYINHQKILNEQGIILRNNPKKIDN